ncbi:MAG: helix-turn-helix domain-containing protein [Candidatus Sungbacteria bacterium]|uniref:Helix-turn-helix domain-containing protein n=1 Tax=Candidatus Sungiibacteriota bacterium TaxID=2750080 RepID=A0A9D6LPD8_9BACT|nr:helix-turn-helix domain-containing protein [Candidatus Sungbacteria bacterium]
MIGEALKNARRQRGLSLAESARLSNLPSRFLLALEAEDLSILGGWIYAERYGRTYADFLGIWSQEFQHELLSLWETDLFKKEKRLKKPSLWRRLPVLLTRQRFLKISGAALIILIGFYFSYQLSNLLLAPRISLVSPQAEFTAVRDQKFTIQGKLKEAARLAINRRPINTAKNGEFKVDLYLSPGLNRINLDATNVSGKEFREIRYIVYSPK